MTTTSKRTKVSPPMISLAAVRQSHGLTQVAMAAKVSAITGKTLTDASLSAIETGARGASGETLAAIELALSLKAGAVEVGYTPSHARRSLKAVG